MGKYFLLDKKFRQFFFERAECGTGNNYAYQYDICM